MLVIADRFYTDNAPQVPSILGTNSVTVSTEGFAVGAQMGGDYLINDSLFVIGTWPLRADLQLAPAEPGGCFLLADSRHDSDPIGDCRTVDGDGRGLPRSASRSATASL